MAALRQLTLSAAGLALAASLAACGSTGDTAATPESPAASAQMGEGRAADIAFAQLMIPHHQQAIEMADLVPSRATSAEVKALAAQIKAAQDPEIAQMKAWLADWGAPVQMGTPTASDGSVDHSGMDMGGMTSEGMMSAADMTALSASTGADFDRMWLRMMVAHHEGAVDMAKQVLTTTKDSAVRTLAEAIVSGQTKEIAEMQTLLGG